ncbi:MAG: hypothetical protein M5R36_21270 [Deltaproteobacteria bacterium]|nr:hypothetical protein [Deltaproteobacteria bacterium]
MAGQRSQCHILGCKNPDMGNGYCRLHYIKYWRQIKDRDALADEVIRYRIHEALVRDEIEGNGRKHLKAVKRSSQLDDGSLDAIIREIQQENPITR